MTGYCPLSHHRHGTAVHNSFADTEAGESCIHRHRHRRPAFRSRPRLLHFQLRAFRSRVMKSPPSAVAAARTGCAADTAICLDLSASHSESDRRRFSTLPLLRTILSVLVAVAIVLAPMAGAWAGGATGSGVIIAHAASHSGDGVDAAVMDATEDCASTMKGEANPDSCPCCDADKACPPQLCMAKCFQLFGIAEQSASVVRLVTAMLRPSALAHPPDWADQPQPPPPRT